MSSSSLPATKSSINTSNQLQNFISLPSTSKQQRFIQPQQSKNQFLEPFLNRKRAYSMQTLYNNQLNPLMDPLMEPLMGIRERSGTMNSNCSTFSNDSLTETINRSMGTSSTAATSTFVSQREMEIAELLAQWKQQSIANATQQQLITVVDSLSQQQFNNDIFVPSTTNNISEQFKVIFTIKHNTILIFLAVATNTNSNNTTSTTTETTI